MNTEKSSNPIAFSIDLDGDDTIKCDLEAVSRAHGNCNYATAVKEALSFYATVVRNGFAPMQGESEIPPPPPGPELVALTLPKPLTIKQAVTRLKRFLGPLREGSNPFYDFRNLKVILTRAPFDSEGILPFELCADSADTFERGERSLIAIVGDQLYSFDKDFSANKQVGTEKLPFDQIARCRI